MAARTYICNTTRIKKLRRTLSSLDHQLKTSRTVIAHHTNVVHALLATRDRTSKEMYEVAKQDG